MVKTSENMRTNPLFMRNEYPVYGKWELPIIRSQDIDLTNVSLIACSDTKANDNAKNKKSGVHFFVDDYRFEGIYRSPERSLKKYSQYAFLLTPDFSTYADMNMWRQIESVAYNRWCGAFWQHNGQSVIPSISWSTPRSYEFCFDGIEKGSIVAVGMIGCKNNNHTSFIRGYNEMLRRINPRAIICYGKPFPDMSGNIITVDYTRLRKVVQ